ncbi:MAG: zf-HC2 domain-containing protein [Bryobacterales bacterium]|nr:zf-HC2 domain-containing protein [Bryobacterales bacterium]
MKLTCAQIEPLLCDLVDGVLPAGERVQVDAHLAGCAACRELVDEARVLAKFLERVPLVEPPPELVTRILFETHHSEAKPVRERAVVSRGWLGRVAERIHLLFQPVLQPRFAMGMAMTILSFSMIGRFAGISERTFTPADLDPAKIWMSLDNKAHRLWERMVKNYENLRVVYQIQNTLAEWSAQEEEDRRSQQTIEPKSPSGAEGGEQRREKP